MRKSLVALDFDHIKQFVFGTDRLKEIRGASALLDQFNREEMLQIAREFCQEKSINFNALDAIYLNGGSGLFLLMTDEDTAREFGKRIQKKYHEATRDGASITYVVHKLPDDLPDDRKLLWDTDLSREFEILRYRLREAKANPPDLDIITLPSHPFMRSCDSCGINYAEYKEAGYSDQEEDVADDLGHYCAICRAKQKQDNNVKRWLRKSSNRRLKGDTVKDFLLKQKITSLTISQLGLWQRMLFYLDQVGYDFNLERLGHLPERPNDFNTFRNFVRGKEYLGLIYADANNMGTRIEHLKTLDEQARLAAEVDKAIHVAVSKAIAKHLPLVQQLDNGALYPFDILLLGGDDIVMVTDASKAMDVAYTIAQEFYHFTEHSDLIQETALDKDLACTLSIGVVLAPIKYPFNLLIDMSEDALKAAKKGSLKIRNYAKDKKQGKGSQKNRVNDSCINFVVVTGGSIKDFESVDKDYKRTVGENDFHATLRPYDLDGLNRLLTAIKEGHKRNLGRTKLHALREAILEKNLTTSVSHSLAVLRNWREEQRKFVVTSLYEFGGRMIPKTDPKDPTNDFPRVTFPWFVDQQESDEKKRKEKARGKTDGKVYRTAFLDFVELFDFVTTD